MRARFKLYCFLLLFFLFSVKVFGQTAQKTGLELSNSINTYLKKNGYTPYNQSLVTSGENTFPYNVSIKIKTEQTKEAENLVLIFFQDDVYERQEMMKELLAELSNTNYNFDITVLFAYGEKQIIEKQDMIFGTQVFIDSITSNLGYSAIIFNLEGESYSIETSASGTCSPPWLIQNACNSFIDNSKSRELPLFFLSQISNYKFFYNRILSAFFESEIPAIIVNLNKNDYKADNPEDELSKKIVLNNVERFNQTKNRSWEHHFLIIRLFGRFRTISEAIILKITLPVIFFWLVYIFLLFFVNTRMKRHAWSTIKKIWYLIPVTYLIITGCFFFGRFISAYIFSSATDSAKIYGQFTIQIIISLFISELFYICILFLNYRFEERSIDYLLVICCFINQSVFIITDISLCPIFLFVCILSLISLVIKNDLLHIIIFVLMILPFIPYGNDVIKTSDSRLLYQFISSSHMINFVLPLALYPCFIILFRNLTAIRSNSRRHISRLHMANVIFMSAGFFISVSAFLIILSLVRTNQISRKQKKPPVISLSEEGNRIIDINYNDEIIFGDIVRTLDIHLDEKCIVCDVQVNSQKKKPIRYTDNDYKSISDKSIRFSIPDYPPQKLTFSYGASPVPCRILVSAVLSSADTNEYRFITKSIQIGDME